MTKVSTYAEGNFNFGYGGKLYLKRNEEGKCYAFLNGIHNPYSNGSFALAETVADGFKPAHNTHLSAVALQNGKILPNVSVDFVFLTTGQVLANVKGMSSNMGKIELCGSTTYNVSPNDWNK